jgi:hypothetical protein
MYYYTIVIIRYRVPTLILIASKRAGHLVARIEIYRGVLLGPFPARTARTFGTFEVD